MIGHEKHNLCELSWTVNTPLLGEWANDDFQNFVAKFPLNPAAILVALRSAKERHTSRTALLIDSQRLCESSVVLSIAFRRFHPERLCETRFIALRERNQFVARRSFICGAGKLVVSQRGKSYAQFFKNHRWNHRFVDCRSGVLACFPKSIPSVGLCEWSGRG